jgi:hypothetical protein
MNVVKGWPPAVILYAWFCGSDIISMGRSWASDMVGRMRVRSMMREIWREVVI